MMLLSKGRPLNPANPQIPGYWTITVSLILRSDRRTTALVSVHAARGGGRGKWGRGGVSAFFFFFAQGHRDEIRADQRRVMMSSLHKRRRTGSSFKRESCKSKSRGWKWGDVSGCQGRRDGGQRGGVPSLSTGKWGDNLKGRLRRSCATNSEDFYFDNCVPFN